MNVEVFIANRSQATLSWFNTVFSEPSNMAALPLECHSGDFALDLFQGICNGRVLALIPCVDGVAAGLFFGVPVENGAWTVNQFIMPCFRGFKSFRIAKECSIKAFEYLPSCNHFIGFINVKNVASIICAKKVGFKDSGIVKNYFTNLDGSMSDATIVVKER